MGMIDILCGPQDHTAYTQYNFTKIINIINFLSILLYAQILLNYTFSTAWTIFFNFFEISVTLSVI